MLLWNVTLTTERGPLLKLHIKGPIISVWVWTWQSNVQEINTTQDPACNPFLRNTTFIVVMLEEVCVKTEQHIIACVYQKQAADSTAYAY